MHPRLVGGITAVVAILTLPLGLLAGLFVGFEVAAVVFILGWFLLTPLIPIVANEIWPRSVTGLAIRRRRPPTPTTRWRN